VLRFKLEVRHRASRVPEEVDPDVVVPDEERWGRLGGLLLNDLRDPAPNLRIGLQELKVRLLDAQNEPL